jgi:hypothetical protein
MKDEGGRMKTTFDRIILKTKWGKLIDSPTKCDECQEVKPKVMQYSKSNRQDCVRICDDCSPRVFALSFPRDYNNNTRDEEYVWDDKFNNDDLEIPSDDAMNRSVDGSFGTSPRR